MACGCRLRNVCCWLSLLAGLLARRRVVQCCSQARTGRSSVYCCALSVLAMALHENSAPQHPVLHGTHCQPILCRTMSCRHSDMLMAECGLAGREAAVSATTLPNRVPPRAALVFTFITLCIPARRRRDGRTGNVQLQQVRRFCDTMSSRLLSLSAGAETCALETCSFSKYAGFTGTRLGWTVIPDALKFADGSKVQVHILRLPWSSISRLISTHGRAKCISRLPALTQLVARC